MFQTDKYNKILISKGDRGTAELFINAGTKLIPLLYEVKPEDAITLYVFPVNGDIEDAYFTRVFTISDVTEEGLVSITFEEEDTADMDYGTYWCKIILTNSTTTSTLVDSQFVIYRIDQV